MNKEAQTILMYLEDAINAKRPERRIKAIKYWFKEYKKSLETPWWKRIWNGSKKVRSIK